jgi:3-hydroxyisobutyrate dehydrogenase-like beta-hydroxyacid dehydrogenase
MKKVSTLGIGAMGSRIATNPLDAGYELSIWNRNPEQCGKLVERGLQPGAVAIECSTTSAQWCQELASLVLDHGAYFLDAPVVGSRPQAEARQLIHVVGGQAQVLE